MSLPFSFAVLTQVDENDNIKRVLSLSMSRRFEVSQQLGIHHNS